MLKNAIAIIPARGRSKIIPKKNIKEFVEGLSIMEKFLKQ
jgi:CMP-N-acetylneuraminic acid synthetase